MAQSLPSKSETGESRFGGMEEPTQHPHRLVLTSRKRWARSETVVLWNSFRDLTRPVGEHEPLGKLMGYVKEEAE